ncbi:MAG: deoxyribose-phosphate aldolase, partial [Bacteroidetes bacterium]
LLKPTTTPEDIVILCEEARKYNFYAVCISSSYVYLAAKELKKSKVKVAATVGFPLGTASKKAKVAEAKECVKQGADEIDMVINIGFLKNELYKSVREEISEVKKAIGRRILKVIIETCYLTDSEKRMACSIVIKAGADFVKTSTGFGPKGATLEDVALIKEFVGNKIKIKASVGIKDTETTLKYIEIGAHRIGTSSGVSIVFANQNSQL